jgi:4-hydroxybenzoate polyprenyltransferase/phosphoserine phosphatase
MRGLQEKAGYRMVENMSPLVIDLDGTLLSGDSLWESIFALLRVAPQRLFSLLPFLVRNDRAHLKAACSEYALPGIPFWPFNFAVLEEIRIARSAGRSVWLATAADRRIAEAVGKHLGHFDGIVSSEKGENLKGAAKAEKLRTLFGEKGFDYIGDSEADLPVWRVCREAVVVCSDNGGNTTNRLFAQAALSNPRCRCLASQGVRGFGVWIKALRLRQWVKNILIAVPMLLAHRFTLSAFFLTCAAFVCFSVCASAGYLLNDLLDLDADRRHPTKKLRPFASGQLPLARGLPAAALLLSLSLFCSVLISPAFASVVAGYIALTLAYSHLFKKKSIADTMCLGLLYTLRIIAGAAALNLPLSNWLLAFSFFLFLGLAFIKRLAEMRTTRAGREKKNLPGRGYAFSDIRIIESMACASGFAAVVILALYIESVAAVFLYSSSRMLWGLCPAILYWYCRMVMLAYRGEIQGDPVAFACRDKISLFCGLFSVALVLLAI